MKTIIVSYSFTGNNKLLADYLKEKLNCDFEQVVELKKRRSVTILLDVLFSRSTQVQDARALLDTYDMVLFVAPVWNAKIATPMASFLWRERNNIRNYAFITLCGGQKAQQEKLRAELYDLAQQEPLVVAQLEVADLLPLEQRGKIRYTTPYRATQKDLKVLEPKIREFIGRIIDFEDQNASVHRIIKSA